MKPVTTIIFFIFCALICRGQGSGTTAGNAEQQLENATASNADAEIEDDSRVQQMEYLMKNPIDLNEAGEEAFTDLNLLTPLQIQQLLLYRSYAAHSSVFTNCRPCRDGTLQ